MYHSGKVKKVRYAETTLGEQETLLEMFQRLELTLDDHKRLFEDARGRGAAQSPPAAETVKRSLPALPENKTRSGSALAEKTVLLHGPPGVGKSTLASQWADGEVFWHTCVLAHPR